MQFPDVCFGGAPGLEAAEQLSDFFPTMDLHFAGGVALRAGPLNYLFVHAAQVRSPANDVSQQCSVCQRVAHTFVGGAAARSPLSCAADKHLCTYLHGMVGLKCFAVHTSAVVKRLTRSSRHLPDQMLQ